MSRRSTDPEEAPPTSRRDALVAAGAGLAALAGCAGDLPGRERVRRGTVRARTGRPLVVDSPSGDVTVVGEDRGDVRVEAVRRTRYGESHLDRIDVVSGEHEGEDAYVVRASGGGLGRLRAAVDVRVRVPRGHPVRRLHAGNGRLTVSGVGGDPTLRTGNGDVRAVDVDGFVHLESENGRLEAAAVGGVDRATTDSGTVSLAVDAVRRDVTVATGNGDVDLRLGDIDARVVASTTNGRVEVDVLRFEVAHGGPFDPGARAAGRLGAGEYVLRARTENGDVGVTRL